jgi:hypothetical protein
MVPGVPRACVLVGPCHIQRIHCKLRIGLSCNGNAQLFGRLEVLNLQVLALTLIPLLSGVVPGDGGTIQGATALLGIEQEVSADFLVGTWKCSETFFRWGITDRQKVQTSTYSGTASMSLNKDGTLRTENFLGPAEGRWELTARGIVIHDPKYPERGSKLLTVHKRDKDRIWVFLPFSDGAVGVGMVKLSEEEASKSDVKIGRRPRSPAKGIR